MPKHEESKGISPRPVEGDQHVGGTRATTQPASGSLGGAKGDRPETPKK